LWGLEHTWVPTFLAQLRAFSSAELMSPVVVRRLSVRPSVSQSVSPSVNKAQIVTTGDMKLKSDVGCPQVTLTPPARN